MHNLLVNANILVTVGENGVVLRATKAIRQAVLQKCL